MPNDEWAIVWTRTCGKSGPPGPLQQEDRSELTLRRLKTEQRSVRFTKAFLSQAPHGGAIVSYQPFNQSHRALGMFWFAPRNALSASSRARIRVIQPPSYSAINNHHHETSTQTFLPSYAASRRCRGAGTQSASIQPRHEKHLPCVLSAVALVPACVPTRHFIDRSQQ